MEKCETVTKEECEHVVRPRWFPLPSKEEYYDDPRRYRLPIPAEEITEEEWNRQAIKLFQCTKCGKIGREECMLSKAQLKERKKLQHAKKERAKEYAKSAGYKYGATQYGRKYDGDECEEEE